MIIKDKLNNETSKNKKFKTETHKSDKFFLNKTDDFSLRFANGQFIGSLYCQIELPFPFLWFFAFSKVGASNCNASFRKL